MFFFEFYESGNLSEKLHVEEWSPNMDQVLMITVQLGMACFHLKSLSVLFFSSRLKFLKSCSVVVLDATEFSH
jgi:hypothetical protein